MEMKKTARVLIRRENASDGTPWYVAQVLEHDLATQAKSIDDVTFEIQRMIAAHIICSEAEGIAPFSIPAAPQWYVDEYVKLKQTLTVDVTRFRADQLLAEEPTELAFRFAPGV